MKTLIIFIQILILTITGSYAQEHDHSATNNLKTATFQVSGNCESCKSRIEKAAKIPGVVKAEWNQKTKKMTLTYHASKVNSNDIQKKIAASGHDTEQVKATTAAYNALPQCCKYR